MATQHLSRPRATPNTVAAITSHRQPYDQELPLEDHDEHQEATPVSTTADAGEKQARPATIEGVTFGAIKPSAPGTFSRARTTIPEDHPLVLAFRKSYESGAGIDVETPDPKALTKVLRKIAAQEGKGVSIREPRPGVLAFQASDRKKVVRKKPAAGA